jgi:hypothetical protein
MVQSGELIDLIGRGERIRTSGPLLPKQVRYQAAPLPEHVKGCSSTGFLEGPSIATSSFKCSRNMALQIQLTASLQAAAYDRKITLEIE